MPRIDSHQHFWRLDQPWCEWPTADLPEIWRSFGPDDLIPEIARCGIEGTVLVQSQPDARDTEWMLALAGRAPFVLGVVGWVDMHAVDVSERIAALAARPKLKGLRPMLQNLPSEWILAAEVSPALKAMASHELVFDALVRPQHVAALATLADRYPMLTIIVDHVAKPHIDNGWDRSWADSLSRLAERPNVACKLSGLVTEAGEDWACETLRPYAAHVLEAFGPHRVLWGSDWPVVLLRATYAAWYECAAELIAKEHWKDVFGANAARLYGLQERAAKEL